MMAPTFNPGQRRASRHIATIAATAFLIMIVLSAAPIVADGPRRDAGPYDPGRLTWSRLDFHAKKLFMTAETSVTARSVSTGQASADWIEVPAGKVVMPDSAQVIEISIDAKVAGRESREQVWLEPHQATAVQRLKDRLGKKAYRKTARFTDTGVFVRRQAPADGQSADLPLSRWSKVEDFDYPHPIGHGCTTVSEPAALFYVLAAGPPLGSGATRDLCLFSNKTTFRVRLERLADAPVTVDYAVRRGESSQRRQETVNAWRIAVRPGNPAGGNAKESEDFELLGLEGDVEIWLDPEHRVPLQLQGKLSGMRVAVRLQAAELR